MSRHAARELLAGQLFLEPVTYPIKRFDHVEGVVDRMNFLRKRLMWLSIVRLST
jgi:hypothetical protein